MRSLFRNWLKTIQKVIFHQLFPKIKYILGIWLWNGTRFTRNIARIAFDRDQHDVRDRVVLGPRRRYEADR